MKTYVQPSWLDEVLGVNVPAEGAEFVLGGRPFVVRGGIPRDTAELSPTQKQTGEVFQYLWQRGTFRNRASLQVLGDWYAERYGDIPNAAWWKDYGPAPVVVDAGCGAGISGLELFGDRLKTVRYVGLDISDAVDRASASFAERGLSAAFLQADITRAPLRPESVDVIYSQGVLHHTDSTEATFKRLATLLKPGGRFLFYVYRRKGPVREFTDDHLRARLGAMTLDEAWDALMPLTRLGQHLGQLDVELDVPQDVALLDIPAGRTSLQRFFYWNIAKAFYHPDMTLDEMNHINFDWYLPANAHRHDPEEAHRWCDDAGFDVEHENLQPAGITVIARRRG